MKPFLTVSSSPEPELERILYDGLAEFNKAITGYIDSQPLHVIARLTEKGKILGGLTGKTSFGLLFIDLLYVPETLRGHNVGSILLAMAEEEAQRRNCKAGVVYTLNFQAPRFYEQHGWQVFGEIQCAPAGASRVFLKKVFCEP
jgi:GNAT superfamily N-acetyltransferase